MLIKVKKEKITKNVYNFCVRCRLDKSKASLYNDYNVYQLNSDD